MTLSAERSLFALPARKVEPLLFKLIIIILISLSAPVWAQPEPLSGFVRDQNGAAIAGAKVSAMIGGTVFETLTDDTGHFHFDKTNAGLGRILVSATGFTAFEGPLTAGEQNVDIVLSPAPVSAQVTVAGFPSRLGDTPQSVIVLERDEIAASPAPTLDDKLRQVPGLTLFRRSGSRTANPTSQGVSLRGTGGSGASRAAVTVDGFPLNDSFGGWIYWGRVPGESTSSVEVLRGSAGEVSGSSAIGGVISVSSQLPTETPVFDLDASFGSQSTALGSLFTSIGRGKLRASLAAEAFHTDGFIAVAGDQQGPIDTRSGVERGSLVPYLEYSFTDSFKAFLSGEYFQERRANGTPLQTNDTKIVGPRMGVDLLSRRFGELTFRAWFLSQIYHQSFSSIGADRTAETLTRLQTLPSRSIGSSLQWSRRFSAKGWAFAGAEFRAVSGSSDELAFVAGRPTSFVNSGGREFTIGAFAGATYNPSERLVLSAGARVDRWREYSGYSDIRPVTSAAVTRTVFPDKSEAAVSPRISGLFRIGPNVSLTATFTRGFRQPTLNELYRGFRVGNVLTLSNENLRAERATTVEAGSMASLFGDRVYLRAVVFCTQIDQPVSNVTLSITPTLITRQRQNLGSTRSCGVEADSNVRLSGKLSFSAGYLLVDARVRRFPADERLEGLRIPQVARHQLTFQARYSYLKIADVSLQLRAADSQFDDDQNLFRLKGFTTVDIYASRRIASFLELYLAVENVFDSTIEAGRTPVLTFTNPRTIRAGLRIHLGKKRR